MTGEEQITINIALQDLLKQVEGLHAEGYRLVQIGATGGEDVYEINYSFDKNYQFRNLRLTVQPGTEVPSITGIYWGAFVYENEIHDLFGIPVIGINIDFKGTFIKTAKKHPFSVTRRDNEPCQNA
jgi:ech hydrogenase subunit D